jgi:hypothetical protein
MNDEKDNLSTAKQEIAKKLMNSDKKYLSEAYTDGEEFEDFEEYGKGYEELYTSHGAQKIKKTKKITPVLDVLDAYVDGSFKDDIYSYGCVFLEGERVVKETSGTGDKHIKVGNISGEILAAEKAILWAISKGYKEIILYYDFEGVENGLLTQVKQSPI